MIAEGTVQQTANTLLNRVRQADANLKVADEQLTQAWLEYDLYLQGNRLTRNHTRRKGKVR